ncbi:MAG: hypothetical protein CO140_02315 [Candidatus Moranbacteria bacterium CG_4_9_14_3_um_filter_40_7]|nr:MAG: hypothetical protein COX31_03935 [Candidatus Moranbacteria bacterium CG23_combo_of_CG06-09_8_20_14_all_40_16]PIU80762.1 MAG: hypothetical protein COS71_01760 [Candidatus Moranbacteria bacterium CG06_land_8_20_14_3_00_40_12]PJA87813.1 MAG: hypothetical protein CO140_02315 [Candidatus Moranbacteria bacterium CG_4_9_14_3_um_filter_40_7]
MENSEKFIWKGTEFWTKEIKQSGVFDRLRDFNDVITGKEAPHLKSGYGEPVIQDVTLDGKICDIYHTDHKPSDTGCRIYIHIKG